MERQLWLSSQELHKLRDTTKEQLYNVSLEINNLNQYITSLESNEFWKLRNIWLSVKRRIKSKIDRVRISIYILNYFKNISNKNLNEYGYLYSEDYRHNAKL